MKFKNYTNEQLENFANIIKSAANSFYETLKIIYIISEEDFYNISGKDIFRVSLIDITNTTALENLNIRSRRNLDNPFESGEFVKLENLIFYYFAVRLPMMNRLSQHLLMSDKDIKNLFNFCISEGAENHNDIIQESINDNIKIVKQKLPEIPFEGHFVKRFCLAYRESFREYKNKDMFFFGSVPILFQFYQTALIAKFENFLLK